MAGTSRIHALTAVLSSLLSTTLSSLLSLMSSEKQKFWRTKPEGMSGLWPALWHSMRALCRMLHEWTMPHASWPEMDYMQMPRAGACYHKCF